MCFNGAQECTRCHTLALTGQQAGYLAETRERMFGHSLRPKVCTDLFAIQWHVKIYGIR